MECGETFSEAWVPHLLPMLRNFLAPTLYRHTILFPSVSASPLFVQIADEGSMPKSLSTPSIVFSVPLLSVALFCAEATVAFAAISTAAKATAAMFRLGKRKQITFTFHNLLIPIEDFFLKILIHSNVSIVTAMLSS